MALFRVLVVEDEPWIALDLEDTITAIVPAVVIVKVSVAGAREVLHEALDFVFLDVDVTNGKTYDLALVLSQRQVPFVFVSASRASELPPELRDVTFIPKPFQRVEIERALRQLPADGIGSEPAAPVV